LTSASGLNQTPRECLIEWANQQDGWVRSIVAHVISTRREVSPDTLRIARDQYLAEKQLVEGEVSPVPLLGDEGGNGDAAERLVLAQLRDCAGVNALASRQQIDFNPGMTILFGENAAGKTGYVRILKLLANVRSAETIIPDIHRPSAQHTPEAVVLYTLGDADGELSWHGEKGVSPFTRMSVFDNPAAALHLEDSVTYLYTPADLALFSYAHAAIEGVRALLQSDMTLRLPRQNPFLTAFARGTPIYPRVETLGASTNLRDLEALAAVTLEEKTDLEALRFSIAALTSSSGGDVEMLRSRAGILRNLLTVGGNLAAFDADLFAKAVDVEQTANAVHTAAAAAVFGAGQLPEELHPAWQRFIEAGEEYLQASGESSYPEQDDRCLYCQQSLDDAARTLLQSYRNYASGAIALAVREASAELTNLQRDVLAPTFTAALQALQGTLPTLGEAEHVPDWLDDSRSLVVRAERVYAAIEGRVKVSTEDGSTLPATLLSRLAVSLEEAKTAVHALEGDAKERAQLLGEQKAKVALLEARLRLAQLLPEIRTYVEDAAWAERLRTLLGRFQGLLTSLTVTSKIASEEVLNHGFERVFNEECGALRAPTVTLDFPGRRGQAARRKSVAPDHSLTEILSEGEQKVIAIADFLAEVSLRSGSAPVVFDDPVTSFDHRRIREIARRIAALSREHQVIVFTHDIWFTSELLAEFEQRQRDCTYYQLVDDGGIKGIVSRAAHPRLDNVNAVKRRLNAAIQDAAGGTDEDRQHRIDSAYSEVRTWCEIVAETELLKRVTQRHQPNVAMQNLASIRTEGLRTAIDVIYPIWEKANRYTTAHSQPLGTLGVRATVNELKQDWAALQQALEDYEAS
jgi:recombinational DNA repair ATPase RecF